MLFLSQNNFLLANTTIKLPLGHVNVADNHPFLNPQYYFFMKTAINIFFFFVSVVAFSQKSTEINLNWSLTELEKVKILSISGYGADMNSLPVHREKKGLGENQLVSVTTSIIDSKALSREELKGVPDSWLNRIESVFEVSINYSRRNKKKDAVITYFPLIKKNGAIHKITSFERSIIISDNGFSVSVNRSGNRSFAVSSQLASGSIFKYSVQNNGIYKISFEDLEGIQAISGSINSSLINVFANHDGMLPERNGDARIDDLKKNAIKMVDGGDGTFDEGDYFLFYASGPHKWKLNQASGLFEYETHLYDEKSYVFIKTDDGTGAKRIQDITSTMPHNKNVTSFNDFQVKEDERVNLLASNGRGGSGKNWLGDVFDVNLRYTYGFNFPNIDATSSVFIKSSLFALTANPNSASFSMSVSGLGSVVVPVPGITPSSHSSFALQRFGNLSFLPNSSSFSVVLNYNKPNGIKSVGYLDYLEINCRRNLRMSGNQMEFRDVNSVGAGNISKFTVQDAALIDEVWDVTNAWDTKNVMFSKSGGSLGFNVATDSLRTFIAFNSLGFLSPQFESIVENQNLHGVSVPDMLIVYHPLFENQVDQLISFHQSNGLDVLKTSVEEIYNEFSGGKQDVTAIKTFAKMLYDRSSASKFKYLLLFGDCSYDYKGRVTPNHNFVPVWESWNSESDISSFATDDFYALLDDGESMGDYEQMDVAVGRFTVVSVSQAQNVVNKIINYQKTSSSSELSSCNDASSGSAFGDWRNKLTYVTDDVDESWELAFTRHVERIIDSVEKNYPTFNHNKVYMDAFNQTSLSGGARYLEGAERLRKSVQEGTLITSYEGHGGEIGWGNERFLDVPTINGWSNKERLTVMLTATCEFTKYDDPGRTSAGELCFLNPEGAAIALFTTTRPVFQFSNERLIESFFEEGFVKKSNGSPRTMGEIYMETKNSARVIGDNNVRRFGLIGDPALQLAFPKQLVVTTEINNKPVGATNIDTLKALSKITIKGYVADNNGAKLTSYNGVVFPTVYDKPLQLSTLGNRTPSDAIPFTQQTNVLYKGKATVKNGEFEYTFIVPKDINYQFGLGKISYYCFDGNEDGAGYFSDAVIGGTDLTAISDNKGPEVGLYMNDASFVSGGITDENPTIYAEIFDSNGINTTGNGIGHDITAILDEKSSNPIILNNYYESDIDSYQSGKVNYPLENIAEGAHTLSLKTWDTQNNSSDRTIDFVVVQEAELAIDHVLNYPNPFTTRTEFYFEHNQHCDFLEVQVQVFTISGKLVKTINQLVRTKGFRVEGIAWDGRDDFGDRIGRGTYVYKVKVEDNQGNKVEEYEKLVLLK